MPLVYWCPIYGTKPQLRTHHDKESRDFRKVWSESCFSGRHWARVRFQFARWKWPIEAPCNCIGFFVRFILHDLVWSATCNIKAELGSDCRWSEEGTDKRGQACAGRPRHLISDGCSTTRKTRSTTHRTWQEKLTFHKRSPKNNVTICLVVVVVVVGILYLKRAKQILKVYAPRKKENHRSRWSSANRRGKAQAVWQHVSRAVAMRTAQMGFNSNNRFDVP